MTQEDNIKALHEDMKYAGFGKTFNPAIEYYVQQGTPLFELRDEAYIDKVNHRVENVLHFKIGTGKEGERHYYNGMQSTLYKIDIPPLVINGVDIGKLEQQIQQRPRFDPVAMQGDLAAFETSMQPYHTAISQQLQQVAQGDTEFFNSLMVKYNPTIHFEQDPAWLKEQEKMKELHTVTQFFTHSKKITATEAPNLLYGRAVNKEYYSQKDQGMYNTWLKLNFNKKKTESGNFEYDSWHQNHGFNIDTKIDEFNFKDFDDQARKDTLYALRKGFQVELTGVQSDKTEVLLTVETNPEKRTVNLYNQDGDLVAHNQFRKTARVQRKSTIVRRGGGPSRQSGAPSPDAASSASPANEGPSGKKEDEPSPPNEQKTAQQRTNSHYRKPPPIPSRRGGPHKGGGHGMH